MNVKTWIPLGLAVALGLVAMVVARKVLRPGSDGPPANTVAVVTAKRNVPVGHDLTADDLSVVRVATEAAPTRHFETAQELVGRVVTTPLVKGQPVLDTLLAPAGSGAGVSGLVSHGMRAITIEVNEFSGLAGMLVPGSRVDVICAVRDKKQQGLVSRTILQNIKVLAIGKQLGAPAEVAPGQPARRRRTT